MSSSKKEESAYFQVDAIDPEQVTSASLKDQIDKFHGQGVKMDSFHAMFKLNKRIIKDLAENIRKQKPGLLKILNINVPLQTSEDCFYLNGISQVLEQTRQMAQHYMRTIDKFEIQLVKQHTVLKEEGKLLYKVQKENKEEFKNQKSSFESMVKKLKEAQGKVSQQLVLDFTLHNRSDSKSKLGESSGLVDQRQVVETNERFLHIQATCFYHTIQVLYLRAEQCLAKANNLCMESARTIQTVIKEFFQDKLDKCIDPSLINLTAQKCKDLSNQITQSQNLIEQCQRGVFNKQKNIKKLSNQESNSSQNTSLPSQLSPSYVSQTFVTSKQLSAVSKETFQETKRDSNVSQINDKTAQTTTTSGLPHSYTDNGQKQLTSDFSRIIEQKREQVQESRINTSNPFSIHEIDENQKVSQQNLENQKLKMTKGAKIIQQSNQENHQKSLKSNSYQEKHIQNYLDHVQTDSNFIESTFNPTQVLKEYNGVRYQGQQQIPFQNTEIFQPSQVISKKRKQSSDKKDNSINGAIYNGSAQKKQSQVVTAQRQKQN